MGQWKIQVKPRPGILLADEGEGSHTGTCVATDQESSGGAQPQDADLPVEIRPRQGAHLGGSLAAAGTAEIQPAG